jgi:hypothetical protein
VNHSSGNTASKWKCLAGALYVRVDFDGYVNVTECVHPQYPSASYPADRLLALLTEATRNVTLAGEYLRGREGSVTVQHADIPDLIQYLESLPGVKKRPLLTRIFSAAVKGLLK